MADKLVNNEFSDYGSGNTSDSSTMSWGGHDNWAQKAAPQNVQQTRQKSSSFAELMMGRCTIEDVMKEFKMNGSDTPFTQEDDTLVSRREEAVALGLGTSSAAYLRQKSWPEPERSPAMRLPAYWSAPAPPAPPPEVVQPPRSDYITEEHLRVLSSLPNDVLYFLLRGFEQEREVRQAKSRRASEMMNQECRFCKNNGERESYFRSHSLKDASGRVRCPVLRAFVCRRCGAHGDAAHTIKYCPLASHDERMKSAAMMRSVRLASGRRRRDRASPPPLTPLWAALEQKLML